MIRAALALAVFLAAGAAACRGPATARPSPTSGALQATLDRLSAEAAWRTPASHVAIAVVDLTSGARASVAGDRLFVSASSAKAWWVAAALDGVGVERVEPYAAPVFVASDNDATGLVIDLVGPDRVNRYLWDTVGMRSTALTQWRYGRDRVAASSPRRMGTDNYTTADDALRFLERLHRGEILDRTRTRVLLGWMTRTPRSGLGGWLTNRLPPAARRTAAHKAGWLEPGCCSDDHVYNTLNEIGLVTAPGDHTYAVVILTHAADDYWGKQVPFVEYASCEIYRAIAAEDDLGCTRPTDPRR